MGKWYYLSLGGVVVRTLDSELGDRWFNPNRCSVESDRGKSFTHNASVTKHYRINRYQRCVTWVPQLCLVPGWGQYSNEDQRRFTDHRRLSGVQHWACLIEDMRCKNENMKNVLTKSKLATHSNCSDPSAVLYFSDAVQLSLTLPVNVSCGASYGDTNSYFCGTPCINLAYEINCLWWIICYHLQCS